METTVYVDVLLVLNYVVNLLLVLCTAKLTGRRPKRRRIVAAALFGSASALTIFLPYLGFGAELSLKLALAAALVRIAFPYTGFRAYGKQLFVFFATSVFFGGVMLALWVAFAPGGMIYHNGVVYFNISSLALIVTTAAAYAALTLAHRLARGGRVRTVVYRMEVCFRGRSVSLRGLVDTGNSLYEPFSHAPVAVCRLEDIAPLLPAEAVAALRKDELNPDASKHGVPFRLVPYGAVGGAGMIPAFRPERILLFGEGRRYAVEDVFIGITGTGLGGGGYNALLNPDLIAVRIDSNF